VHIVNLGSGGVESVTNITDIHEMLHIGEGLEGAEAGPDE
jgi:hypothetical protein